MLAQDMMEQLRHAPMTDRIQAIEVLLQSLKHDIVPPPIQHAAAAFIYGSDIQLRDRYCP